MEKEPLTVYPVTADADEELDVPEFETDVENSYIVKIDKIEEDMTSNEVKNESSSLSDRPKSGFSSLVTAIRVAKWLAKAYGYATQKKLLYAPQDTVIRGFDLNFNIDSITIIIPFIYMNERYS